MASARRHLLDRGGSFHYSGPVKICVIGIPGLPAGKHNLKDPRMDKTHELVEAKKKVYAHVRAGHQHWSPTTKYTVSYKGVGRTLFFGKPLFPKRFFQFFQIEILVWTCVLTTRKILIRYPLSVILEKIQKRLEILTKN